MARAPLGPKQVDALQHGDTRLNIPTAEMQSFFQREEDHSPRPPTAYPREKPLPEGATRDRDPDRDPQIVWNGMYLKISEAQIAELAATGRLEIGDAQLVWRGKDNQDWSDLIVQTPPLYIQEKIHPKAIIEDLKRQSSKGAAAKTDAPDLFADFNGVPPDAASDFYQHDQHWSNRMILGDSLQVMASLAERERLKGKVQAIYFDPPYGIKFNSNWQVSTQNRDVKDGKQTDISREPEQVKAFRDTWRDGIHSYLTYLRDRLTVMRDLLTESGSIFVQIGDENVHRVRAVMDEVFGETNFVSEIAYTKTTGRGLALLPASFDYIVWYAKSKEQVKYRAPLLRKEHGGEGVATYHYTRQPALPPRRMTQEERNDAALLPKGALIFRLSDLRSQSGSSTTGFAFEHENRRYEPGKGFWKSSKTGFERLAKADRLQQSGSSVTYRRYVTDYPAMSISNLWEDTGTGNFTDEKIYVVQTAAKAVQRCLLMATDPGDLVLDPTCGSGTTAFVAEQWGRRWITIDTSRVALALARTRLMAARYPWYLLSDSTAGAAKEAALKQRAPSPDRAFSHDLRLGFVYDRVPHIMLKDIANNARIDDIWDRWQAVLEPLRVKLNTATGQSWEEWQIPRELADAPPSHAAWWEARIDRQREIDEAIAAAADVELLYDRPFTDNNKVRVAGPFTVESLSPHRIVASDQADDLADALDAAEGRRKRTGAPKVDFAQVVIEHLKSAGVHQSAKGDKIAFDSVTPWPGKWIGAEARFMEGEQMRRAAVLIGPEYGTLVRNDLTAAAREAVDTGFDVMIAVAFNYDAHSAELERLGPLPILKARMNPDLHMAGELKNTGKGNLFVIFGEPDIDVVEAGEGQLQVKVNGVDVYDPNTGDIRSGDTRDVAAWFIDTDYNEESFFVRHAYFLGANDPYKSLKTALRAEIDEDAWATLYSDTSRPFDRPKSGAIAVKVINHFGDEVMKVYRV